MCCHFEFDNIFQKKLGQQKSIPERPSNSQIKTGRGSPHEKKKKLFGLKFEKNLWISSSVVHNVI